MMHWRFDPAFWIWSALACATLVVLGVNLLGEPKRISPSVEEDAEATIESAPAPVWAEDNPVEFVLDRTKGQLVILENGCEISQHAIIPEKDAAPFHSQEGWFVCVKARESLRRCLWGCFFPTLEEAHRCLEEENLQDLLAAHGQNGTIGIFETNDICLPSEGKAEQTYRVSPECLQEIWTLCNAGAVLKIVP